jgi:TPR repeat protein
MQQIGPLAIAASLLLSACSEQAYPLPDQPAEAGDTGTVYVLTPSEKAEKEALALAGDADAAFRLAQHYGMAGGDTGRAGDPKNAIGEDRWLKVAAANGHGPAQLKLALNVVFEDCAKGRELLRAIAEDSSDPEQQQRAQDWLNSGETTCSS